MTTFRSYTRRPRTSSPVAVDASQVARAYNFPAATGRGSTAAVISLGGVTYPGDCPTHPAVVAVAGNKATPDPQGADVENALDVQTIAAIAPDAAIRFYSAANTDDGFLAAVMQAINDGVTAISISWGQAETQWARTTLTKFATIFAAARAKGIPVYVAAGDSGADDGTGTPTCDYPASDPNVIGCGGTRLLLNPDGSRAAETVWNDNPTSSATGGGVSTIFGGSRQVPDIAGNADPDTGYRIKVNGQGVVVGGTSAVAPLFTGLHLLLAELTGA